MENEKPTVNFSFLFDQSSNHNAFAAAALVASRMTLNPKPWPLTEKYQFKDAEVELSNGQKFKQTFFEVKKETHHTMKNKFKRKEVRYFKGIKKILQERNRWLCLYPTGVSNVIKTVILKRLEERHD